jgi:hypothetical protein
MALAWVDEQGAIVGAGAGYLKGWLKGVAQGLDSSAG